MTAIVLCLAALAALVSAAILVLLRHAAKADDVYPSEAAEVPDPVDAQHDEYERSSYFVDGGHPNDCAERCCWEIRLTEMHDAFDWGAYEHEMRSKR